MGNNLFSGKNLTVKITLVVIAIVLLLAICFYAIMDGIVNLIFNFFKDLASTVINIGVKYVEEIVLQIPFDGDLKFYKIDDSTVDALKDNLEGSGINTETCGLTQVRLRKILLAQAVSTSFSQTLCMATVTDDEILENVKQKDKYKNIDSLQDFLDNPVKKEDSKDLWPETYNYTLYYDSEKFFYFKDKDNIFGGGANQWYLGAMGAIELTKEDGTNMVWGNEESFQGQKDDFEAAKETWTNRDDDFSEEEVLNIYTDGDSSNEIRVWNIITKQKIYDYTFKNDENGIEIEKYGKDEEYTYEIKEQVINIQDKLDVSSFAISIELMIDLLDMTSSGEFLETFIDYALRDLNVNAKAFQTNEVQIAYSKEKFNISNGFVIEVYDFIDTGDGNATDLGDDNFRAYADIVYKRTYQGRPFESVAKLLKDEGEIDYDGDFKETVTINAETVKKYFGDLGEGAWNLVETVINFAGEAADKFALTATIKGELTKYITENEDTLNTLASFLGIASDKVQGVLENLIDSVFDEKGFSYDSYYQVGPLSQYLKTAYDPGTGFTLGNIEVEEKIRTRTLETSCDMAPSKVETWYGTIEYSEPNVLNNYLLSVAGGEEIGITEDEYNNFGYSRLDEDTSATTSEQKERIYASNSIAVQYYEQYGSNMGSDGKKVEVYSYSDGGTDLTDEVFKRKPGYNNKDHYDAWTSSGLFEIGAIDNGIYNKDLGGTTGSDYIYLKYTKENIKKYKDTTKIKRNILDTSNVTKTVANNDMKEKLKEFLGLLKNVDGTIPTEGTTKEFKKVKDGGKVVLYGDIYKGHIPAGDLLLDNGALMLFELLEANESTQGLVNIFKYLAYLYSESGTDYGVTDISQLVNVIEMNLISGVSNSGFWWPIGSSSTTNVNGVTYASGTPVSTYISSGVGPRWGKNHGGIDITGCAKGTNIIAARAGIVVTVVDGYGDGYLGSTDGQGYGNHVKIQHDDGTSTIYAHLLKNTIKVKVGDTVEQGQVIGGMGTSGNSTGTHLHFEIRDASNNKLDPEQYVSQENPRPTGGASNQTIKYAGKTITYDDTFARQQSAPTQEMIERTIVSKTTCYDLCYFCCEKTKTDPLFGVTASGMKLSGGERIVAADTNVIPMGTWIYIENAGYYMVADRGGAINGTRIDIFMGLPGDRIGDASGGTAGNPKPRTNMLERPSVLY